MSRTFPVLIRMLSAFLVLSVRAQSQEIETLNFNVGGGFSIPVNPTARNFGVDGNAGTGMGVNFNKHNSIEGDFMWSGLSPTLNLVRLVDRPRGSSNLYTITGNYRFHVDSIADSLFGVYVIGGGGWYYRHTSISKDYLVPPLTVCQPIYNWWGFSCDSTGTYVQSATIFSRGSSAGGIDAGMGFTIKLPYPGWTFFLESRYNHAWSSFIPTTLVPVTFGFRFN